MPFFNVGDKVKIIGSSYSGTVIKNDNISQPIPLYTILIDESNEARTCYELSLRKLTDAEDALRYGDVLTDDEFKCDILDYTGFQIAETNYYRFRTIRYENRIFYHKMVNGEVVEFKELTV